MWGWMKSFVVSDTTKTKKYPYIESLVGDGDTFLHLAARHGNIVMVNVLIAQGCDFDAKNTSGYSALDVAMEKNHPLVVIALVQAKASCDLRKIFKWIVQKKHYDLAILLVQQGLYVDYCEAGETPLTLAAASGKTEQVQQVLAYHQGKRFSAMMPHNGDALAHAIKYQSLEMVQVLVAAGIPVNRGTDKGETRLHLAAKVGSAEICAFLIEQGATLEAATDEGMTPLLSAVEAGNLDCVKVLQEKGANLNAKASSGANALYIAITKKQYQITQLLLDAKVELVKGQYSPFTAVLEGAYKIRDMHNLYAYPNSDHTDAIYVDIKGRTLTYVVFDCKKERVHGEIDGAVLFMSGISGRAAREAKILEITAARGHTFPQEVVVQQLLKAGVMFNPGQLVKMAIERGWKEILKAVVDNWDTASFKKFDWRYGCVSLAITCYQAHLIPVLKALGADFKRGSPLEIAVQNNYQAGVLALMAAGVLCDLKELFPWAVQQGHLELFNQCIAAGVLVESTAAPAALVAYPMPLLMQAGPSAPPVVPAVLRVVSERPTQP